MPTQFGSEANASEQADAGGWRERDTCPQQTERSLFASYSLRHRRGEELAMIDTIACYTYLTDRINLAGWDAVRAVSDTRNDVVLRAWCQVDGARLNYRVIGDGRTQLSVEFSAARWSGISRLHNLTQDDVDHAISQINQWISSIVGREVDISRWTVTRIDYAYNWHVNYEQYDAALRTLEMSNMSKTTYRHGVEWKRAGRWVKYYNKARELGYGDDVLRFECSNYRRSVAYMAARWFGCERTVSELAQEGRALVVIARMMDQLHIPAGEIQSARGIDYRIKEVFGAGALAALGAWHVIRTHGAHSVELGLMSRAVYYRWRRAFASAGVDCVVQAAPLPALTLPVADVVARCAARILTPADTPNSGIGSKNLGKILGVRVKLSERINEADNVGAI